MKTHHIISGNRQPIVTLLVTGISIILETAPSFLTPSKSLLELDSSMSCSPGTQGTLILPSWKQTMCKFLIFRITKLKSYLLRSFPSGHELREITFDPNYKIGRFRAHDFFGDGSFYLLDVPGHATGHMCGLARTTLTTFTLLGADTCHIAGCFRPSEYNPMPANLLLKDGLVQYFVASCPCSMFSSFHPAARTEEEARVTPYYKASDARGSAFTNPKVANESIKGFEEFDAHPDVLVCLAHDTGLLGVLPMLNDGEGDIGDWKIKEYKEATNWRFLNELPRDGKQGRPRIVNGFWRDGKQVATFDG